MIQAKLFLLPQIIMVLLKGVKKPLIRIRINLSQAAHQIFHFRTPGLAVCGAWRCNNGQFQQACHMLYMAFRKIYQGPDHSDTGSAHRSSGMKRMEPTFIKERHQQRFDCILPMMTECEFVESFLNTRIGQNGSAHFGTQGAWVFLPAVIKNDFTNLCFPYEIFDLQLITKGFDW